MSLSDPYKRLVGYFDEQVVLGDAGAYNPHVVPFLWEGEKFEVATLVLPVGAAGFGPEIWVLEEDGQVAWFALTTPDGHLHQVTLDQPYKGDDLDAINKLLAAAGL